MLRSQMTIFNDPTVDVDMSVWAYIFSFSSATVLVASSAFAPFELDIN